MSQVQQIPDLNFAFSGVPNLIDCFPSYIRAAKKIQVYCMSSAHVSDLSCWQRKALQTKTEDHPNEADKDLKTLSAKCNKDAPYIRSRIEFGIESDL